MKILSSFYFLLLFIFIMDYQSLHAACCQGVEYDPTTDECCGPVPGEGVIVPIGRCCGGVPLEPQQKCCPDPVTLEQPYDPQTTCCTVDCGRVDKKPTYARLAICCPDRYHDPNNTATSNGCSAPLIGDNPPGAGISFKSACDAHDFCYETCNEPKADCDTRLRGDILNLCATAYPNSFVQRQACNAWADIFYVAVSVGGESNYEAAQEADCICCD